MPVLKKIFALILCGATLFSATLFLGCSAKENASSANAAETIVLTPPTTETMKDEKTGVYYAVNEDGKTLTVIDVIDEDVKSVHLPYEYDGKVVVAIGDNAFAACMRLADLTLPSGLISIGRDAFDWCSALTHLTIPKSVREIRPFAFYFIGPQFTEAVFEDAKNWNADGTMLSEEVLSDKNAAVDYLRLDFTSATWTKTK